MKRDEVKVGKVYSTKIGRNTLTVRIDGVNSKGGWNATNTATGKRLVIKSAERLSPASAAKAGKGASQRKAEKDAKPAPTTCGIVGCDEPATNEYRGMPRCAKCYATDLADALAANEIAEAGDADASETPDAPAAKKPRTRKPAAEPKPKRVSALDAAAQVLQSAGQPMRTKEMIEAMASQGLWSSPNGKTPEATLYAAILREINVKGPAARFRKVERGQFTSTAQEA